MDVFMPLFPWESLGPHLLQFTFPYSGLTTVIGNNGVKFMWCILTLGEQSEGAVMNNSIHFQHSKSLSFSQSLLVEKYICTCIYVCMHICMSINDVSEFATFFSVLQLFILILIFSFY